MKIQQSNSRIPSQSSPKSPSPSSSTPAQSPANDMASAARKREVSQDFFNGLSSFAGPDPKSALSGKSLEKAIEMGNVADPAVKTRRNESLEMAIEMGNVDAPQQARPDETRAMAIEMGNISAEEASAEANEPSLKVAVIDDFVAEENGFNHGEMVASTIEKGGVLGEGHHIQALRFNIDQKGTDRTQMISSSLAQILRNVQNGADINAVNLSQQAFSPTVTTRRINSQIDQLEALGVAVVVAAGNEAGQVNELARSANLVVENADENGRRAATSGIGNVLVRGNSTSQAAANFAPLAAFHQAGSIRPHSVALSLLAGQG